MKTLLLTGYDDAFAPLGDLASPFMDRYAKRHGFRFLCQRVPPVMGKAGGEIERCPRHWHPSWWKMWLLPRLLTCYERVIWVDADMVVTNPEVVPPGEWGYHCSKDWGVDATESWMLTNCCFSAFPDCLPMVRWVLEHRDKFSTEFHEQEHVRQAVRQGLANDDQQAIVHVHPSRVFAAVPSEVHPSVVDPWRPGDWVCHLTMLPLPERVRLVPEILKQAGLK